MLYSVSRKLDTLLSIIGDNPRPNTIKASDILPKFPICNHEDLVKFNKLLTDNEAARTQYVITFSILVNCIKFYG